MSRLTELAPDLIIVVAYGRILPEAVLNLPKYGCINAHASLLPKYRGAAPMQRAIMDGESETGVTVMKMDKGLDTGDMILTVKTPITDTDDLESIHDRLADISGDALIEAIKQIENGTAVYTPQDSENATYAEKILKDDCIKFIRNRDGSRVLYDKENPRAEIYIYRYREEDDTWLHKLALRCSPSINALV
jgi:methionyl-tRNA formyltransferase